MRRIFFVTASILFLWFSAFNSADAVLTCSVSTSCANTTMYRMSSTSNAHASTPTGSAYTQLVCCGGIVSLGNSCSGNFATILKMASTTNSHVQQNSQSGYANDVCISAPVGNTITVAYQASNCTNYDTTLGSMSAVTNSQVGDTTAYPTKICAKITLPQSLSFSLSTNAVGFGPLSSSAARYATADSLGNASEVEAHQILVSTNAASGYSLTVKGATLASGTPTIAAIGGTATTSLAGTEQFGMRLNASGGLGTVTSPYGTASNFAYAANSTTASQIASATTGDDVTTTYSVRYLANIRGDTESATYNTSLIFVTTANF